MMIIQPGVKVHLAAGFTDLRRGLDGLAVIWSNSWSRTPSQDTCSCSAAEGAT